jgi:toxin ParE1/3/4
MSRLKFLPSAFQQLKEIGDYIALENPIRAASYIDELIAACRLRADMPRSGQKRPELDGCPHSFPFGSYIALYDILEDGDGICVVAVFHGRADISQKFQRLKS